MRMRSATLYKVLSALMVLMAAALLVTHTTTLDTLALPLWAQVPCGVAAGFGIGVVAAVMDVAGGELLIPTIVLLFGEGFKTAGSLSLLASPPTMLVASPATAVPAASPSSAPTSDSPWSWPQDRSSAPCWAGCSSVCSPIRPSSLCWL